MLPIVMGAQRLDVARRIAQLMEVPRDTPIERIVALRRRREPSFSSAKKRVKNFAEVQAKSR